MNNFVWALPSLQPIIQEFTFKQLPIFSFYFSLVFSWISPDTYLSHKISIWLKKETIGSLLFLTGRSVFPLWHFSLLFFVASTAIPWLSKYFSGCCRGNIGLLWSTVAYIEKEVLSSLCVQKTYSTVICNKNINISIHEIHFIILSCLFVLLCSKELLNEWNVFSSNGNGHFLPILSTVQHFKWTFSLNKYT
jgi:hypothetical protein